MVKRLLVVTQKVDKDDPVLGFFHAWLLEFAKQVEHITVIGLSVGTHALPKNVRVVSLGKERGKGRIARTVTFVRFIVALRNEYDSVFVHMNPIYIAIGGLIWRGMGKKIALWYTHRNVDLKLRLAVMFSNIVFTASPHGCRVKSKKVNIIGHGIDTELFSKVSRQTSVGEGELIRIAHIGRLTPIKNCHTIIEAVSLFKERGVRPATLLFVGDVATESDRTYKDALIALVKEHSLDKEVRFVGNVSPAQLPTLLSTVDLTINATPTGGIDKVVLESMAAGVPVLTSNRAFLNMFGKDAPELIFKEQDQKDLAQKIEDLFSRGDLLALNDRLKTVAQTMNISSLVGKIVTSLGSLK